MYGVAGVFVAGSINQDFVLKMVSDEEDTVRLYRLCADCLTQVRILGEATLSLDPDFYII